MDSRANFNARRTVGLNFKAVKLRSLTISFASTFWTAAAVLSTIITFLLLPPKYFKYLPWALLAIVMAGAIRFFFKMSRDFEKHEAELQEEIARLKRYPRNDHIKAEVERAVGGSLRKSLSRISTRDTFLSTPLYALEEERHFALVDGLRVSNWARFESSGSE